MKIGSLLYRFLKVHLISAIVALLSLILLEWFGVTALIRDFEQRTLTTSASIVAQNRESNLAIYPPEKAKPPEQYLEREAKIRERRRELEEDIQRERQQRTELERMERKSDLELGLEKLGRLADANCRIRLLAKGIVLPAKSICVDVDTVVKNLTTAVYRFNKPDEAFVEEAFRVVLVLPTAPGQDVRTPFKSTEGQVETRVAPYAQNMEATLRGDSDLKISPSGPQERVTTSFEPTTWEWTIVPERAGNKNLVIEVTAQLVIGTDRNRVPLRTIYESIQVHVRWGHWFSVIWAFINSVVGFAVGAATLAIGVLGVLHYRSVRKTEEVPGVDLVGHKALHDHTDGGDHQAGEH